MENKFGSINIKFCILHTRVGVSKHERKRCREQQRRDPMCLIIYNMQGTNYIPLSFFHFTFSPYGVPEEITPTSPIKKKRQKTKGQLPPPLSTFLVLVLMDASPSKHVTLDLDKRNFCSKIMKKPNQKKNTSAELKFSTTDPQQHGGT
ncbi:hypothetical protein, unlikely [Trypanosoma brucei gambiense DAL972]|uniref:Uncharacterized protein n=1 Tax=Trypanosoma brucei gambiense (strain MHOM/CI/86/DAL972) TaxID=679716 RepID=D0A6G0_TRYB9|nr:hypothetical protein, unlikely [Trypanosoma brucei gambiense DAL972]CBH17261.1 hypothetical protein, unlikely [Trypanosoma brucei gambiense DAL972]|eukprot:XP_011779525.1 hypothetical protein, unlikely [Trypanosoma brucei gambiense DAL972]